MKDLCTNFMKSLCNGIIALIVGQFFCHQALASVVSPSDKQYYSIKVDNYYYIYTDEHRRYIPEIIDYNRHLTELYEKSYNWVLDETTNFGVASNNAQISNGFATIIPRLETIFYPNGLGIYDFMNGKSWMHNLLIHETAHLYQLNIKSSFSSALGMAMGRPNPLQGFIFGYMVHPNAFAPTFMVEGNATYMESIFDNGGRLRSGANYALLLQMAKTKSITSRRLINSHLFFPYGSEKYIIGGYFNAFLAKKYGVHRLNRYFENQASHYLNPFRLDAAFKETFSQGYEAELSDFQSTLAPLAAAQKQSEGDLIASTTFDSPLSFIDGKVYFINKKNGRDSALLMSVNEFGEIEKSKTNFSDGPLFKIENEIFSSGAYPINTKQLKSGLFNEDLEILPGTENRFYTEYRSPEKYIYGDVENSFNGPTFYVGQKRLEGCHSLPRFVGESSTACFQQKGDKRTLVKEGKAIFSLNGHYAKLVGGIQEKIYFIASTQFGSGLFSHSKNGIRRLSSSDTIVDARVFDNNSAVITEVTSQGFEYKFIQLNPSPGQPQAFDDFLVKENQQPVFKAQGKAPTDLEGESKYGVLKNLRFSSFVPTLGVISDKGLYTLFTVDFADPLQMNSISASYGSFNKLEDYFFQYSNSKYLMPFGFGFIQDGYNLSAGTTTINSKFEYAYATTVYPIFRKGIWSSNLVFTGTQAKDTEGTNLVEESNSLTTSFTLTRTRNLPLSMYSSSLVKLGLIHEGSSKKLPVNEQQETYSFAMNLENQVGDDSYLFLNYKGSVQDGTNANIRLSPNFLALNTPSAKLFYRMTNGASKKYFEVQKASLGFKKGFHINWYSSWFPLGLRRASYFMNLSYFYGRLSKDNSQQGEFNEFGHGVDTELLLFHKLPFRVLFLAARNNLEKDNPIFTSVIVNLTQDF